MTTLMDLPSGEMAQPALAGAASTAAMDAAKAAQTMLLVICPHARRNCRLCAVAATEDVVQSVARFAAPLQSQVHKARCRQRLVAAALYRSAVSWCQTSSRRRSSAMILIR